ncbi:methylglutaconyl-mitochondrial-like [Stylonychia lemnae]|uniref:Methylglutaconyl-mitochondrial-like n=1 Tax=Stylonychia lemnae TaxID=5949 RepID=A0A078A178_STYLE|nr:methylglutaconyl-mitochondrial-like [Stylonychia lemnae]|eukprot:CDW76011.1 methylglutaconyl-mitochondrial-like [Stylonychia lemnae]
MLKIAKRFLSQNVERHLLVEKLDKGVVVFSLNREKSRNALSRLLLQQLEEACHENVEANAIILKSQAPGMFCAGADLKERKEMTEFEVRQTLRKLKASFMLFENLPCPTISILDGAALGGGLELALCSDIRIATKQAQLGLPETSLAIIPGAGGTQRLPRLIGASKAKELIFTGDRLTGDDALRMGLVNHVADDYEQAYQKAIEIANKIGEKGPIAIKAAKQAISYGMNMDLRSGLELEEACYAKTIHTEDRMEGLKAFAEKRKPVYKGK